jgi:hypothetical protein
MSKNDDKSNKPKIELVTAETIIPLKRLKIRNFWNTCGSQQECMPCKVCRYENKRGKDGWSITDPKYNYCFWQFIKANSYPDGWMNPLSQAQTAKMLGVSTTAIHIIEREAIEKLKKGPYSEVLAQFEIQGDGEDAYDTYTTSEVDLKPTEDDSED